MKIARARVVAQSGPHFQHPVDRCPGERFKRWKARQESLVIRHHGLHLRLLEHDFGQPDAVRIGRFLPGQVVTAMGLLPFDDATGKAARTGTYRFRHSPARPSWLVARPSWLVEKRVCRHFSGNGFAGAPERLPPDDVPPPAYNGLPKLSRQRRQVRG